MLFTDTITIYNCVKTAQGETWHRSVLDHVMVTIATEKIIASNGTLTHKPVISVTIPKRSGYVDAKEYNGEGWTAGLDNLDIITLDKCDTEITANFSITQLKKSRPNTWTIKSIEDNSMRTFLPHWVIKCEA